MPSNLSKITERHKQNTSTSQFINTASEIKQKHIKSKLINKNNYKDIYLNPNKLTTIDI